MREYITKAALLAVSMVGVFLLLADMPKAGLMAFVIVKAAGALMLYAGARALERILPEEEV